MCVQYIGVNLVTATPHRQAFVEPASILAILVLNAAVGVWQSRSAQDSLDALKKLQPDNACVVRDGEISLPLHTASALMSVEGPSSNE